jgi:hypothetical protein
MIKIQTNFDRLTSKATSTDHEKEILREINLKKTQTGPDGVLEIYLYVFLARSKFKNSKLIG